MALGTDLVCLSEMFNHLRETQSCVPDRHQLASALFAQKDQHAATGCGMLAANDACRFPRANRGRTLSPLFASPEWGEDRRG